MRKKTECEKQFYVHNRLNFIMSLFCIILVSFMGILLAFMLQFFIESVERKSTTILYMGMKAALVYVLLLVLFQMTKRKFQNEYIRRGLSQFKEYVFSKMLDKSIAEFEDGASARFLSAFSNDLNSIETNFLNGTLNLIMTVLCFLTASIAMLFLSVRLAVPVIAVTLICIVCSLKYGQKLVDKENETSNENMSFVAQVKDLLNGFIVIKSFKAEKEVLEIFQKKNIVLEETKQGRRETSDAVSIFGNVSSMIVNILIFGLGFRYAFQGVMSIGMVIAFIQLGNYILQPVQVMASLVSNRNAAISLIERISDAIEQSDEVRSGEQITSFDEKIELSNVGYSFEEEHMVLSKINAQFEKGKSYAIVGGSGSGKSTILKILLGFYPDYEGTITIDGKQLRDIDLDSLYDYISIIQQDVFLFDSTIQDNITMFHPFEKEKVDSVIMRSGLSELIEKKGSGYLCGEGGCNLSGGEKQRISIARCLIRETPILLMDEATAALDNATAQMVESAVLSVEGLTKIVVTHRYNEEVMKQYDKIFVMNKGRMIEEGTFDGLMEEKGYFYSLFNVSQAE